MTLSASVIYISSFIAALAVLVLAHELGHYLMARAFDVKVLRFAFGFGRVLGMRRFGPDGTEWAVCAFPLGGYVKMLDESEGSVSVDERGRAFNRKRLWQRSLIVAAGPAANLVLAVMLYAFVFFSGVHEFRPVIGEPVLGSAAADVGIRSGSTIISLNGTEVATWQDVRWEALIGLLDSERVRLEIQSSEGAIEHHVLIAPAGAGNAPERDSLKALGLALFPLRLDPVIGAIVEGSPAAAAGFRVGDRFHSVQGEAFSDWNEVAIRIRRSPGVPLVFDVHRGEQSIRITAIPATEKSAEGQIGRLGVAPYVPPIESDPRAIFVSHNLPGALVKAVKFTWQTSVLTLRMIGRMVLGEVSWKNVSGPVTMADYAGQSAQLGFSAYLRFLALISISLGVLNLLPIPVLDGGHLLYYLVEAVAGKPLPEAVVSAAQRLGIALLGVLMFFAFYNDINRLVSG